MNGGEICNNEGTSAGAVVLSSMGGTSGFIMNGGKIYGNSSTADQAGAILVDDGCTFNLKKERYTRIEPTDMVAHLRFAGRLI